MKENILKEKSYRFAVNIVNLVREIQKRDREYVITKQLLRSATSVGANIEESIGGRSARDLYHKLSISYKEARETHYWLRLMHDTGIIKNEIGLIEDVEEILRLLGASTNTLRKKLGNQKAN